MSAPHVGRNGLCSCGSGKRFKHCCYRKRFKDRVLRPRPVPDDGASLTPPWEAPETAHSQTSATQSPAITRVAVNYVSEDFLGKAEVSYSYPIGTRIIMADGNVLPVEYIEAGMRFRLEDGGAATVAGVGQPKLWEPLSQQRDGNGNAVRRIVGTVKYTGVYPRLDLVVAGETIKTTPSHLFYSANRRAWVPAETLRRGELLCNPQGVRLPIESVSEIYFERGSLYNVEVEDLHTYYAGGGPHGGIWSHNGLGLGCSVPKAAVDEALENGVIKQTTKARAGISGIAQFAKHHVFPQQFRNWFKARGINVDDYLVTIDRTLHEALHAGQAVVGNGGWYNNSVFKALVKWEATNGRRVGFAEAKDIIRNLFPILFS